jgi:FAD-dependent urate hydroxylase
VAHAAGAEHRFDFVIAGTGYYVDLAARPELADVHREVQLWRDRYAPPPDDADDYLGAHPYLGTGHEYLEKRSGSAPYLRDIHLQNPAGFVSFGLPIGDIPSMKRDIPTIVARISGDLFLADHAAHQRRMTGDVAPDFGPEIYASAIHSA